LENNIFYFFLSTGPGDTPRDSPNFPSPRLISNKVFKATENVPDTKYSGLVMAWGQLIDQIQVLDWTATTIHIREPM
jgi:hypothetical protein